MKKRYQEGGEVREGPNENIDDPTRARALKAVQRRMAGEADEAPAAPTKRPAPAARPAPAKPVAPAAPRQSAEELLKDTPTPSGAASAPAPRPGMMERAARAAFPNPSFPGKGPESSLPAVAGVGLPAAARGVGRAAGALASAAGKGFKAGRAERAAERSEARYPRGQRDLDRMEGEGPVRTVPAKQPRSVNVSARERTPDEELMQAEGGLKRGGAVKKYAKGGSVSASRRGDGIAMRGKTRGRIY